MAVAALIICLGSAVIASAKQQPQFLGGRFVLGFGVSVMGSAAPSYCVEICPPQWRGRMTGFYNLGWFGGSIPAAGITLATQKMTSDWSWRLPIVLQCAPAFVVICSTMFLPESPRWLMAQGRDKEALAFLTKYHGAGDDQDPIVQLEYVEFKDQIEIDGSDKRVSIVGNSNSGRCERISMIPTGHISGGTTLAFSRPLHSAGGLSWSFSWVSPVSSPATVLVCLFKYLPCVETDRPILRTGYFNLDIYKAVGYDTYMQFVLNLANSFTSAFSAACGVYLADHMPRRKVLSVGTLVCGIMLGINGGLSAKWAHQPVGHENLAVGRGAVAAYFFFGIGMFLIYYVMRSRFLFTCP